MTLRDNKGRFVKGHKSISTWIRGSKHSQETKDNLSVKHKNISNHKGRFQKGRTPSKEIIIKAGLGHRGKRNSPATEFKKGERRSPSTEFKKGNIPPFKNKKGIHLSPQTEFKKWELLTEEEKLKARSNWSRKPTRPENYLLNILNKHFPNEWKYTGDYKFWIEKFNPDFINVNGKKLIIEFDGIYWHSLERRKEIDEIRNNTYKKYGYMTLSLNENDLQNESNLLLKIKELLNSQ